MNTFDHDAVKSIFEEIPWGDEVYDLEHALNIIVDLVPFADYFFTTFKMQDAIDSAQDWARSVETRHTGYLLYSVSNNEESIHCLALPKDVAKSAVSLIKAIQHFINIDFIKRIKWNDVK